LNNDEIDTLFLIIAVGTKTSGSRVKSMLPQPPSSSHSRPVVSLPDDVSDEEQFDEADWKEVARKLEKENRRLRSQVLTRDQAVEALQAEVEYIRMDVITRSQKKVECDNDLYKSIAEYTKKTLFRHVKFITSEAMLMDLEGKTSLANITMDHFAIDIPDRISWWNACSVAVSDAINSQRNQVNQALKAQVLSK
jgi:cupin superfamily acireductone dioxygenase involved in methionine salvage